MWPFCYRLSGAGYGIEGAGKLDTLGEDVAYLRPPVASPYRLIWALLRRHDRPVDYIYYAYANYAWRTPSLRNYAVLLTVLLVWPVIFLGAWARFTLVKSGFKVQKLTGKNVLRQSWEQLCVGLAHSVSPEKYYNFDLYEDVRRKTADELIIRYVFKGGVHSIIAEHQKRTGRTAGKRLMNHKLDFDDFCHQRGLKSIGSICGYAPGGVLRWAKGQEPHLPPIDLFIKPTKGKGGRGCERWDWAGEGKWRRFPSGETHDEKGLLAHVKALAHAREFLIQKRAVNHPELRDLCGAALSSMRMMSVVRPDGDVEVLFAVFKISGQGDSVVDNFHAGGNVCKVDMASGELGPATDWGIKQPGRWLNHHPVTGAPITGRILPLWRETVEVVRQAHLAINDRVAVGWDVAITDQGPRIIEGNGQFGLDMVQRTHREAVGNSRFCELYAWHIAQAANVLWGLPVRPAPANPPVAAAANTDAGAGIAGGAAAAAGAG